MAGKSKRKLLEEALLHDGEMRYSLYEHELEELLEFLITSMIRDNDEYIFAVTENSGYIAMVLIVPSKVIYINEKAREKLKEILEDAYTYNMKLLIPDFIRKLRNNDMPIYGAHTLPWL